MANKKKKYHKKKHPVKQKQVKKQPPKQTQKQHRKQVKTSKPNFFDMLYKNYIEKYPFLVFLALLVCVAGFVFWDFIILDKLYLFKDIGSDSINIFYPRYAMSTAISQHDLLYTFRDGLGAPVGQSEISSKILGWLTAPHSQLTNWIVGLFTNESAYQMFFSQLTNIVLAAIVFYFYLKTLGVAKITNIAGGLMFAFCGVMILGSGWVYETKLLLYAAFMLFGLELMIKKKTWLVLPLAVFLASRSMGVFWFYPFGLMLFIYSLVRYFEEYEWSVKSFAQYMLKFAGLALLGILFNSIAMYNSVMTLLDNPRVSGDVSLSEKLAEDTSIFAEAQFYITALLRLFSTDMAGGGIIDKVTVEGRQYLVPHYRGWQNYYEGPMLYTSLLTLVLIPIFFTNGKWKNKLILGLYMALFSLPVIFPYFLRAFWAFQGEYFRAFSFVIVFPFFYTGLRGLNNLETKRKTNIWIIILSTIALIAVLGYLVSKLLEINPNFYNLASSPYNKSIRNAAIVFLLLYAVLFIVFKVRESLRNTVLVLVLAILAVELAYMSDFTINNRSVVTTKDFNSKTAYNDYTVDALTSIDSIDNSFYRIEKEYKSGNAVHGSLNDANVQGYFGTSKYSSSPDPRFLRFLQNLHLIKKGDALAARWMSGLRSRPLLFTLINGKYILSKNPKSQYAGFGYQKILQTGDVHIYQNAFALPLGFTYNKYILKSDFDSLSVLQKDISLLRAALIADSLSGKVSDLDKYELNDTTTGFTMQMYKQFTDSLKDESLKLKSFREDNIEGEISLQTPQIMYLSFLYDKNWIVEVDGKKADTFTINLAFTGVKIDAGKHEIKIYYKAAEKNMVAMIANIVATIFVLGVIGTLIFNAVRTKSEEETAKA